MNATTQVRQTEARAINTAAAIPLEAADPSKNLILVPLSRLVLRPTGRNVRKTPRMSIPELAASIQRVGLLQNLIVIAAADGEHYEVVAGGRRLAALKLLADLPFTQVKLDRSFVVALPGNSQRAAICRNIINLARDLKLECVAEGIETPAQRDALQALGCDLGQGYLWSPALPPDMFVAETLGRWTT